MMNFAHILLAHGSHDPEWPAPILAVAERIQQLDPAARVRCAYLNFAQPDLATVIDELITEGAKTIAVWPMFLGLGRHVREDLPRLIAATQTQAHQRGVTIALQSAMAEQPLVLDVMAQVIAHKAQ